jgi:predicted DNA-binding transcriptional regulator YafY
MSAGKNPILRYKIIDQCLSSKHKKKWKPEEIIQKFSEYDLEVELRTLKYDFENMRNNSQLAYYASIGYCRKEKGYFYTEEGYTIYGDKLSQNDLMALTFNLNLLHQFEGSEVLEQTKQIVQKLIKGNKLTKPGQQEKKDVLNLQPQPYYKGIGYLNILLEAIFYSQPLKIAYRKFNDDAASDHIFHPYQLKMYNNRLYIRGFSQKHKDIVILGLDRIEGIKDENIQFREDNAPDDKEYFQHTIGITKGQGPVEEIQLAFTPEQGHYIKTLHLHHTQKMVSDDEKGVVITLQLIQNYELC